MTNPNPPTDPRVEAAARVIRRLTSPSTAAPISSITEWASEILKAADEAAWQPIESAPTGANGTAWMQLAKIDGEETFTWSGMHCRGKFYAAGVFHNGGDVPYEFRQHEVHPTHWRLEQAPPKAP